MNLATSPLLERLLYVSVADPAADDEQVRALVAGARLRNAALEVTGALLYTGSHFAQWLEGPPEALSSLMQSIEHDRRHTQVHILLHEGTAQRRFAAWQLHYVASLAAADLIADLHQRPAIDGTRADRLALHLFPSQERC
jgi:hypothetical protein